MDKLVTNIKRWAQDRDIHKQDPHRQLNKLVEELGELASGLNKNDKDLIIDSVGDVTVVLIIMCEQLGLNYRDCIQTAYEEIKDRKGKLIDGVFVKEEDL